MTLTDLPADDAMTRIGSLVRDARRHRGLTQQQLADRLGTSQSAVARIEQGGQNLTLELLGRLSAALESELISLGPTGPTHLRVAGGRPLRGSVVVKSSKNAAVALLCGALLNRGRTTLRNVARIVEVERILDVLRSIGVSATWDYVRATTSLSSSPMTSTWPGSTPTPPGAPAASSCSWARCCTGTTDLRAALRRRLRPGHPHRPAAHDRAAPVRSGDRGAGRRVPRDGAAHRRSRRGRSC